MSLFVPSAASFPCWGPLVVATLSALMPPSVRPPPRGVWPVPLLRHWLQMGLVAALCVDERISLMQTCVCPLLLLCLNACITTRCAGGAALCTRVLPPRPPVYRDQTSRVPKRLAHRVRRSGWRSARRRAGWGGTRGGPQTGGTAG